MIPQASQEALAAWLTLGLLTGLAMPNGRPVVLLLTAFPWVTGAALLLRPGAGALVVAVATRLTRDTLARLTLLAALALLTAVGLVLTPFYALLLLTWCGAAGLALGSVMGPARLWDVGQRAVLLGCALAFAMAALEGVLRLPFVAHQLGSPAEERAWERRYDRAADDNVFGLRSAHALMARSPGVRRILALGDSFTWGQKVASTDSIWPSRLEADLTHRSPSHPTEVINLSRRGWSTAEEVRMLNLVGWQFNPDRLLLQYYLNDAELPEAVPRAAVVRDRAPRPDDWDRLRSSALLWVLRQKLPAALDRLRHHHNAFARYQDGAPGWMAVQAGLKEIADSAHARGVPVTVILFPAFTPGRWTPATHPFHPLYEKVARTARAEGLEVLDLTEAFAAAGGDWRRWWGTPYDRHPGAAAHGVAARAIADYLAKQGWLDAAGAP